MKTDGDAKKPLFEDWLGRFQASEPTINLETALQFYIDVYQSGDAASALGFPKLNSIRARLSVLEGCEQRGAPMMNEPCIAKYVEQLRFNLNLTEDRNAYAVKAGQPAKDAASVLLAPESVPRACLQRGRSRLIGVFYVSSIKLRAGFGLPC